MATRDMPSPSADRAMPGRMRRSTGWLTTGQYGVERMATADLMRYRGGKLYRDERNVTIFGILLAMRGWPIGLAVWLLLVAVAQAAVFVAVWRFFVHSEHGQLLDYVALSGNGIGQDRIAGLVHDTLSTISVVSLAGATIAVGFIAVARRRLALGIGAVLLVAGSNAT